jgi:hypothetical protein
MSERGSPGPPPTPVAASAPPSTTSASSASTRFGTRASLVDVELSSLQLFSVQVVCRGLGFGLGRHLHKRETSLVRH